MIGIGMQQARQETTVRAYLFEGRLVYPNFSTLIGISTNNDHTKFHFLNFPFCWPYKFTDDTGISAFPVGVELAAGRFRAVLEA